MTEALSAFRRGLHLACVSLLGAVSEGAWYAAGERLNGIEAGREWDRVVGERAQHDAAYPQEATLADLLADLGGLSLSVGHEPSLGTRPSAGIDLDLCARTGGGEGRRFGSAIPGAR